MCVKYTQHSHQLSFVIFWLDQRKAGTTVITEGNGMSAIYIHIKIKYSCVCLVYHHHVALISAISSPFTS